MTFSVPQGLTSQAHCPGTGSLIHGLWEAHSDCSRLYTVRVMNVWNGKILVIWGRGWGQTLAEGTGRGKENWRRAQKGMSILSKRMESWVCQKVDREWRKRTAHEEMDGSEGHQ